MIKFEYDVPLYRQVVCLPCEKGFDGHKYMNLVCPDCGGQLVPTLLKDSELGLTLTERLKKSIKKD